MAAIVRVGVLESFSKKSSVGNIEKHLFDLGSGLRKLISGVFFKLQSKSSYSRVKFSNQPKPYFKRRIRSRAKLGCHFAAKPLHNQSLFVQPFMRITKICIETC